MAVPSEATKARYDIHVRVPSDLYEQLQALARSDERSINDVLLQVARLGVRERTRRHKPSES